MPTRTGVASFGAVLRPRDSGYARPRASPATGSRPDLVSCCSCASVTWPPLTTRPAPRARRPPPSTAPAAYLARCSSELAASTASVPRLQRRPCGADTCSRHRRSSPRQSLSAPFRRQAGIGDQAASLSRPRPVNGRSRLSQSSRSALAGSEQHLGKCDVSIRVISPPT
jgi:hypothetical protein